MSTAELRSRAFVAPSTTLERDSAPCRFNANVRALVVRRIRARLAGAWDAAATRELESEPAWTHATDADRDRAVDEAFDLLEAAVRAAEACTTEELLEDARRSVSAALNAGILERAELVAVECSSPRRRNRYVLEVADSIVPWIAPRRDRTSITVSGKLERRSPAPSSARIATIRVHDPGDRAVFDGLRAKRDRIAECVIEVLRTSVPRPVASAAVGLSVDAHKQRQRRARRG